MTSPDNTGRKQGGAPPFHPGQSGNPKGKPKGARNRLGTAFLKSLEADFAEHGRDAIVRCREGRPHEYLRLIAAILPRDCNVRVDSLEVLTDADLDKRIRQIAAAIGLDVIHAITDRAEEPESMH